MTTLPETMQALIQRGDGYSGTQTGPMIDDAADWLELRTIAVPDIADGQALIRVRRASVNPSDIHFIKGEYGQPRIKDSPAGFEACGDVVRGPDALIGQRVAFVAVPGSGAWAEYALADAASCIPLRPDISDNDGAAQIVNPLTARAMIGLAQTAGDGVIITAAASQLGKLMIGLARDMDLPVIATVRRDSAVSPLEDLGAAVVLNTQSPDFAAKAQEAISRIKPRMMLDAVSDQQSEEMFTMMPNRARWVSYGKLGKDAPRLTQMGQLIFMGKQIEGFWLTQWFRNTPVVDQMAAIQDVQTRFADGRWKTDVAAELRLDQVIGGLADALRLTGGKTMIVAQ